MVIDKKNYNEQDHAILNSYKGVVEGLAALLGEHCEIVLHSLEDLQHSAIFIANGHNTNRKIGSPITDLALSSLHRMQDGDKLAPYFTRAKGNILMKSITIPVRNANSRIIGLLCMNINLDAPLAEVIKTLIPSEQGTQLPSEVNFANSVEDLVIQTLEHTIEEIGNNHDVANNMKNRQIVNSLFEKGIFDIKDAINLVAERLDISRHTVYLYIRQIKNDE